VASETELLAIPNMFQDQVAVVTGAGSGIGKAVALALASRGATVCLVGRSADKIENVRTQISAAGSRAQSCVCDLARDEDILALRDQIQGLHNRVDILVHCAGTILFGAVESASIDQFDQQYRVNARAPVLLTQGLLPMLKSVHGQLVFVNSSVGLRAKEKVGAYAASKHALRAIADTLRLELNKHGVRVISVFPGDTATDIQTAVQRFTGRPIDFGLLIQPSDVASMIVHALELPRTAEVTDIHMRPFRKESS